MVFDVVTVEAGSAWFTDHGIDATREPEPSTRIIGSRFSGRRRGTATGGQYFYTAPQKDRSLLTRRRDRHGGRGSPDATPDQTARYTAYIHGQPARLLGADESQRAEGAPTRTRRQYREKSSPALAGGLFSRRGGRYWA